MKRGDPEAKGNAKRATSQNCNESQNVSIRLIEMRKKLRNRSQHGLDRCTERARLDTTRSVLTSPYMHRGPVLLSRLPYALLAPHLFVYCAPAFNPQIVCDEKAGRNVFFAFWRNLSCVATDSDLRRIFYFGLWTANALLQSMWVGVSRVGCPKCVQMCPKCV